MQQMIKIYPLILSFLLAGFYSPANGMVKCTGNTSSNLTALVSAYQLFGNRPGLQTSKFPTTCSKAVTPNTNSVKQWVSASYHVGFNGSAINLPNQFKANQLTAPQIESPSQCIQLIMPFQTYGATCFTSKVPAPAFCNLKPLGTKPAPAISTSSQSVTAAHRAVLANTFTVAINLKLFDHPYIYLS
jgi:hypothetical protein